jgi:hypothetical protein
MRMPNSSASAMYIVPVVRSLLVTDHEWMDSSGLDLRLIAGIRPLADDQTPATVD